MHLTFDTSTVYTSQGQEAADIEVDSTVGQGASGNTHFWATIRFNGWVLRNATKEHMITTIVHETMHAIFTLRWGQYQIWLQNHVGPIDSFFIKQHYPIHWYWITNQSIPLNELQDHEIMATDYFNRWRQQVIQWWNPSSPQALRDSVFKAMAYATLTETTAWSLLASQGIDTCRYKAIAICAENSSTTFQTPTGCITHYLHYVDSLKLRPSCN